MVDSRDSADDRDDQGAGSTATDSSSDGPTDDPERSSGRATREVEVPLRVYKTIIVFSTLFAVVLVVGGFVVLDVATQRARLELSDVDPLLALAGLAMIVAGAGLYAFATRFRATGMGKSKDAGDESSNNG